MRVGEKGYKSEVQNVRGDMLIAERLRGGEGRKIEYFKAEKNESLPCMVQGWQSLGGLGVGALVPPPTPHNFK